MRTSRAVSPVISVILMIAIVVILVATASVFMFDSGLGVDEPAPNIADTTGEFVVDDPSPLSNQIVQITHRGGDNVAVEELKIIVRASGPDSDLPREARLVNLPAEGSSIDEKNIEGSDELIDESHNPIGGVYPPNLLITSQDTNVWSATGTIQFRISTGGADFRIEDNNTDPEADTLEVIIVHTPSNTIISEHAFTP